MADLIGEKDSNKFVVTTCVHVLDLLIDKNELAVFSIFFPKLFAPFLVITQQPYYGTLQYDDPSRTSWDNASIERAIRGLTRIMITGSVMPNIMDSCSLLIPAVFHAYVFAESSKWFCHPSSTRRCAEKAYLLKLLNTYVVNSMMSVDTFLQIIQGNGLANRSLRFALDSSRGLILRPCKPTKLDQQWILDLNQRESWDREASSLLSCWPTKQISRFFIALLDLFFRSHFAPVSFQPFSPQQKQRIILVLITITDSSRLELFGDDLLQGLRSLERIMQIALSSENSFDNPTELLAICNDLVVILASSALDTPLIVDLDRKQRTSEEESLYYRELSAVIARMLHELDDHTALPVVTAIKTRLQDLQNRVESKIAASSAPAPRTSSHTPSSSSSFSIETPSVALPEIAQDFRSPYQPVRSFALSRLHHLLQTSDKELLAPELPSILSALQKGLNDDDSYVYLAAVNAMVILASTFHQQVLPILLDTFKNAIAPLDLRLRVGEAIVCTVQYMKDACVK